MVASCTISDRAKQRVAVQIDRQYQPARRGPTQPRDQLTARKDGQRRRDRIEGPSIAKERPDDSGDAVSTGIADKSQGAQFTC